MNSIMDTHMEDVGVGPKPDAHLPPLHEPASISTLDGWIENLMNCKTLAESDVQRLCDRVCSTILFFSFGDLAPKWLIPRLVAG